MTGDDAGKDFLRRWSRLKTEARSKTAGDNDALIAEARSGDALTADRRQPINEAPNNGQGGDEPPTVPPVESLSLESDYRPFFHPKIEENLRRAALKKLFSDPHFNVMDGLDVYIDDYSRSDPLPAGMLDQLEQAKKIFAWSREDAEERARAEGNASESATASATGDRTASLDGVGATDIPLTADGHANPASTASADADAAPRGE